jgi:HD-GYP domain-containing protein (c-di-GMP phosphodiesterase class II)
MVASQGVCSRVDHPGKVAELLETACQLGCASLSLEHAEGVSLPVIVEAAHVDEGLCLDISAIRHHVQVRDLRAGKSFRVMQKGSDGICRTPGLRAQRVWEENERLYCQCKFPPYLETFQQRDNFRATLRRSMKARVDVQVDGTTVRGLLRNLSLGGCLAELNVYEAKILEDRHDLIDLEIAFPDGSHLQAPAYSRHQTIKGVRMLCGFEFEIQNKADRQQLGFMVKETEREAARNATVAPKMLQPSPLFRGHCLDGTMPVIREDSLHTPMARRLSHCANYLATLVVKLRQGEPIDSFLLAQQSDYLLSLCDEDREGLLFALSCLQEYSPLIQHCLGVAARWSDISASLGLPATMRKELTAASLVHDLGKKLLPVPLRSAKSLDTDQYRHFQQHATRIKERLIHCQWLSSVAIETVVEGRNRRLDSSGLPSQQDAGHLHELPRLATVIDVVDAMGRDRPDRPGLPIHKIYEHLRSHPDKFAPRWVQKYINHFGVWPVGTLVRFPQGELGLVLSLDQDGKLASVRQVDESSAAAVTEGTLMQGQSLLRAGEPLEALPPPSS